MILVFPMPDEPVMDMFRGVPSLFDLVSPIVGDVAITWRKARPNERPGYVAPVKAVPAVRADWWNPLSAMTTAIESVAEVVPPPMYALDVDVTFVGDDEQVAHQQSEMAVRLRSAVGAWRP